MMIYDYIIIGGGIAGGVCAYELGKRRQKCIILEKNSRQSEKVCGGGVSYKALNKLQEIGISVEPLLEVDSKLIKGHVVWKNKTYIENIYNGGKRSLGIQRNLFDKYLLDKAEQKNVHIKYGEKVTCVCKKDNIYNINGFFAKEVVWASGARSVQDKLLREQSIGISGQICAKSNLADDIFHYWYFDEHDMEKYFWAFPIGHNLWNVGIWSRNYDKGLKRLYNKSLNEYFLSKVIGDWEYLRKPKAEFLGHYDQRNDGLYMKDGIGDFAGCCNPVNGGGIHYAIKSAVEYAMDKNAGS